MSTLRRLLKHWRISKKHGIALFPPSVLEHFHRLIEEGVHRHRAHLKLAIEVALPTEAILRNTSTRNRARAIFQQHRTTDGTDRSHLLIYINLADRRVEIVADSAVAQALSAEQWHFLCNQITHGFSTGDPGNGVDSALNELNTLLEQNLPVTEAPTPGRPQ